MRKAMFLGLFIGLVACQNQSQGEPEAGANEPVEQTEELKRQVMAVHDEVMPLMSPMGRMQAQLREMAGSERDSMPYLQAASDLREAQEGMMDWMRNFKPVDEQEWTEAEKSQYLREELDKMLALKSFTDDAVQKADSLLAVKQPR